MSVINTMLQDLERRRVDLGHAGALRYVRALPEGRELRQVRFGLALLAGAGLAAAISFGPDLWKKLVRASSHEVRAVAVAAPASAPVASRPAPIAEAPGSQGLALTVSRDLLWRESLPPETPPRAEPPATNAQRNTAPVPASIPRVVPEVRAASGDDKARVQANEAPSPPLAKSPSLSIDRAAATVAPQTGSGVEIKQVNAQQRTENEFRRGNDLLSQGRTAPALEAFAQVLAWDSMHDAARQALVVAHLRSKNTAEAERLLVERQLLVPKNAGFAMILARLQAERGDNDLALETLRASLPVAGANPAYHATMAALLARQGQHTQAITQYQAALRLAPQSGVWWMGLGLSLQAAGNLADAQEALRRARASDSLSPELTAFVEQRLKQLQ